MLGLSLESDFTEVPSLLPCAPQQPTLPLTNDKARKNPWVHRHFCAFQVTNDFRKVGKRKCEKNSNSEWTRKNLDVFQDVPPSSSVPWLVRSGTRCFSTFTACCVACCSGSLEWFITNWDFMIQVCHIVRRVYKNIQTTGGSTTTNHWGWLVGHRNQKRPLRVLEMIAVSACQHGRWIFWSQFYSFW